MRVPPLLDSPDPTLLAAIAPDAWQTLVEGVRPAAMLVAIDSRLGERLRAELDAEDIWQDTLLHAWKARMTHRWCGLRQFRRWLLQIAENRIRNAADHFDAACRGGGVQHLTLGPGADASGRGTDASRFEPAVTATPSREAGRRELAAAMAGALGELDAELRDVVRLRLVEDASTAEVAAALGLGESAVKHRLRKGIEHYTRVLRRRLPDAVPRPAPAG